MTLAFHLLCLNHLTCIIFSFYIEMLYLGQRGAAAIYVEWPPYRIRFRVEGKVGYSEGSPVIGKFLNI